MPAPRNGFYVKLTQSKKISYYLSPKSVAVFLSLPSNNYYICTMFLTHVLFISGAEIFFIMFIVVMVFGADKIPGIAKGLGKGMRQLKDATEDIKKEIQKSADKQGIDTSFVSDIKKDIDDVKNNVSSSLTKELGDVKDSVDEITGAIKRK